MNLEPDIFTIESDTLTQEQKNTITTAMRESGFEEAVADYVAMQAYRRVILGDYAKFALKDSGFED